MPSSVATRRWAQRRCCLPDRIVRVATLSVSIFTVPESDPLAAQRLNAHTTTTC